MISCVYFFLLVIVNLAVTAHAQWVVPSTLTPTLDSALSAVNSTHSSIQITAGSTVSVSTAINRTFPFAVSIVGSNSIVNGSGASLSFLMMNGSLTISDLQFTNIALTIDDASAVSIFNSNFTALVQIFSLITMHLLNFSILL